MILSLASVSTALAHPGHDHGIAPAGSRTWTFADSGAHLHGTFVAAKNGQAQIRRDDGRLITLSIDHLIDDDQRWLAARQAAIRQLNEQPAADKLLVAAPAANATPPQAAKAFDPFAKLQAIRYRWDDRWLYVESNGIPDHPLMIGITAWQQQVPLPQKYVGDNAWQIPLHPVPARQPASAKNRFLRGAIALAVNGVPIFNPLNNRGDDAYLFGELDEYGGHCGRADDYHYHLAPVHLEKQVGKSAIIAYALDGYPIYGYDEPDGSKVSGLDGLNGHKDADGHYHYHATKTYPYLNGGFYGEVVERDGQVDPQPRAQPVREALPPLRGAKVTDFTSPRPDSYRLTYDLGGRQGQVSYSIQENGAVTFQYTDPTGKTTSQTYEPGRRQSAAKGDSPTGKAKGQGEKGPPGKGKRPPPANDAASTPAAAGTAPRQSSTPKSRLTVTSSAVNQQGFLDAEFTCDGAGASPPVAWTGAPAETKCFAVSLWHTAPDQEKSYWVVYDIPAQTSELAKNAKGIGVVGVNDKRRNEYDPMCSKGPGVKTYHLTIYALSARPKLSPQNTTRANLLAAIKDIALAEGTLDFKYERK